VHTERKQESLATAKVSA